MITIREIKPIKVSGSSSFLITFPFSPIIVDAIKSLPVAYYHRKEMCWEIPADALAQALDTLTFIDNLQLILLSDENEVILNSTDLTDEEIRSFKIKPFAHQIEAVNFGLREKHKKWLLLDSMGLG